MVCEPCEQGDTPIRLGAAIRYASKWKSAAREFLHWFRETASAHDERMRERDALQAEVERLRRALSEIASALGPTVLDCCCAGCNTEASLALSTAFRALSREDTSGWKREEAARDSD